MFFLKHFSSVLLVIVITVSGHSAEIELVDTLFERDGGSGTPEASMLQVHFVDVGGGDGILIDTPTKKKILIDGGYTWSERKKAHKEYAAYTTRFLGDDTVDLIVISHPDFDHFAALPAILEKYVVRQVWASGYDADALSNAWKNFRKVLEKDKDTLFLSPLGQFMGLGSQIRFDDSGTFDKKDDTILTLINVQERLPTKAYGNPGRSLDEPQRRNSSSIVLRLDYGKTSFLFTGDVNGRPKKTETPLDAHDDQEKFMVDNHNNPENPLYGLLDVDVLKVPHHGSNGSSSLPFLEATSPVWAVITAGVPHGHPHRGVLNRLGRAGIKLDAKKILRTDQGDTGPSSEKNLGDDTFVFWVDPEGIVKIQKWNIKL